MVGLRIRSKVLASQGYANAFAVFPTFARIYLSVLSFLFSMSKSVESMLVRLRSLSSSIVRFSLHHFKDRSVDI